jgi:hypothetical protein
VQQLFEDLAKITSYSNVVTSVWHVQMGSKVDQKLTNGYISLLNKNFPYPMHGLRTAAVCSNNQHLVKILHFSL